jgi:hypothetical protein
VHHLWFATTIYTKQFSHAEVIKELLGKFLFLRKAIQQKKMDLISPKVPKLCSILKINDRALLCPPQPT